MGSHPDAMPTFPPELRPSITSFVDNRSLLFRSLIFLGLRVQIFKGFMDEAFRHLHFPRNRPDTSSPMPKTAQRP